MLQLVSGFAEMFGTELVKNHPYTFSSQSKIAVFSWQGCTISISFDVYYIDIVVLSSLYIVLLANIHRFVCSTKMHR